MPLGVVDEPVALTGQVTIQRVQRGPQLSRRRNGLSCTGFTLEMVHDRVDAINADPGVGGFAIQQPPVQTLNFLDDHCLRRLARWIVAGPPRNWGCRDEGIFTPDLGPG